MKEKRKDLQVTALENGTVIDHIPTEKLFTVVSLLHLDKCEESVTIGNNFTSKKNRKERTYKGFGPILHR